MPDEHSLEPRAKSASGKDLIMTVPMLEAITQNTSGYSEGFPDGVPRNYAWCGGSHQPAGNDRPPPDFTAVTGWGQIYPKAGEAPYSKSDGSVAVANAKTYVHLHATGEWMLVQQQTTDAIGGAHFASDFKGKPAIAMKPSEQPDGSVSIPVPPSGYNDHIWIARRGVYSAGEVDGVYVQIDMKTNDPEMKFVANVGADWWRDAAAGYAQGFSNNPGAGMSNWIELKTEWSTLRFTSWSTSRLFAEPPPPLVEGEPASALVLRRPATNVTPCLPRL